MKTLRFRAWDIKEKKMSEPFGFGDLFGYEGECNAVTLHHPYLSDCGQDFLISKHDGGNPSFPAHKTENGINPDIILMQFTGLYDSKGKEIFYGDILSRVEDPTNIMTVEFEKETWCEDGFYTGILLCGTSDQYTVIGNIYQNEELLK